MFGFYQNFLLVHITPWHLLLKNELQPPRSIPKEQEAAVMTKLWEERLIHQKLFLELKQEVLCGLVCLQPNFKV
jgi:hypothetical protein